METLLNIVVVGNSKTDHVPDFVDSNHRSNKRGHLTAPPFGIEIKNLLVHPHHKTFMKSTRKTMSKRTYQS